jgi:hypothetical protein
MVDFTAPASFYGNRDADVSYFQQNAKEPVKTNVTVNALLAALYSGKNKFTAPELTAAEPAYNAYSAETATIFVDAAKFNQHSALKTAARKITVKTGSYMMISDVLVLDIANTNINKCPVYFTTDYGTKFFDNSLLQQGIVYRLFPLNNANRSATTAQEAKALEQFATKLYQPVIDFKLGETRYHSPDGSNVFFSLYARILEYYQHHGNTVKIKYWLKKLNGIAPDLTIDHMPFANQLFYIYNQYDRRQLEKDVETYAEWLFKKATEYSAISGYLSREECIRNLEWLINSGWASNMDERAVRRMLKALGKND